MTAENITQKELASRLNRTTRQIRKLHDHGIPRNRDGNYPWPEAHKWWVEFKQREKLQRTGGGGELNELDRERARKERALASLRELELEEKLGNLVSVDYVDEQLAQILERTRQVLINLPGKIAPVVVGCPTVGRAQMILQQAIDEAMPTLQAIGADATLDETKDAFEASSIGNSDLDA
jgi:phage terminase Nu1 subunit (DNA packaging protein)